MTADEADAVLQAATAASPPGLVALAEGWPAVIGLAALAGQTNAPPDTVVPKALYDFFAEELFQTAAPDVRRDLCLLAPAAKVDRPLARHVLGDEHGDCVVEESARLGFFAGTPADSFTIHPLLRDFLLTKAKEYDESARLSAVGLIVGYWLSQHAWDDAFVAISDGGRPDLVPVLVEASLDDIVESGRTASLRRWITVADDHEISSPLLYLAQAEIAYREGLNARAELLALQAAEQLDPSVRFYARAYLRAGRAAHFIDRGEEALAHFVRARETSTDTGTRREALWGSFVTAVDIEDPRMGDFLAEYERAATDEVDDVVRGATGRLSLEYRFGSVYAAIHGARRFVSLISDVKNPLIRTAFWNVYGWAFVLGGRYSEAFLPAEALVTDAKEYSVAFAVSYGEFIRAHALLGVNELARARRVADDLTQIAKERSDDFLIANVRTLNARIALISGEYAIALDMTEKDDSGRAESPATRAERLAVHAMAFLAAGDSARAAKIANDALSVSMCGAPRVLARLVAALATQSDDPQFDMLRKVARLVDKSGQVDALILAARTRADLFGGRAALEDQLLPQIRNHDIRRHVALQLERRNQLPGVLSKRETEVLRLVSHGYTNSEIANKLFISDVTVKVHVRHILAKLGVRNRAEAAAIAVKQLQLGGDGLRNQQSDEE